MSSDDAFDVDPVEDDEIEIEGSYDVADEDAGEEPRSLPSNEEEYSEAVNDDDDGPSSIDPVGGEDEEVDYTKVDTRGLGGDDDQNPENAEPSVDPEKVTIDAPVDETLTATLSTGELSDDESVQEVTGEEPDTLPNPERVVALRVRVISITIDDREFEAARGSVLVADRFGATIVDLGTHADIIDAFETDVVPGDDILLTGLVAAEGTLHKYAASAVSTVHINESDEYPAGYYLDEESAVKNLGRVFAEADTHAVAWNRVADAVVEEYDIAVPYAEDDPVWWLYFDEGEEKGLWIPFGRERIDTVLGDRLPYDVNTGRHRREILKNVKVRCRVEQDEFAKGAPAEDDLKWIVGVQNGVVDLRTGELCGHDPKWRLSSKLPVEYKPDEYDDLGEGIDWFLDDVCESGEDRRMCMAMAAHSLMRHHQIKSAFPILGPSNSGKTKWHGIIKRLLGSGNAHTMNFDAFAAGDGFETGKVLGVHAVLDDDASDTKINDLNFFKKVTGGEEISINRKYEKLSDYVPFSTVSWLSNDPAVLKTRDSGVKSRLYPIVMPHRHTEDPDDGHKDFIDATELENRIYAKDELEALLVAAVEKAGEMYETGKVESERTESERWNLYDNWADSVQRFFGDCVVENPDHVTMKSAVYEAYKRWCEGEGLEPMTPSNFWKTARRSGPFFEADVWFSSSTRGVKHVQLGPKGLEFAPDAVIDKLDANGASKHSLDNVTPIREIHPFRGAGFHTVEGTVRFGDVYKPGFVLEDGDGAIRAFIGEHRSEPLKDTISDAGNYVPDFSEGDRVRLEKMEKDREEGKLCLQYVHGYSNVKLLETSPGDDGQSALPDEERDADDDDDDDVVNEISNEGDKPTGEIEHDEIGTTTAMVKNAVEDLADENGRAPISDVRAAVELDDDVFDKAMRKLEYSGEVYEPVSDEVKAI